MESWTRERDFLSKSETHEKHGLSADLFFLFPSPSTFFLRATSTPLFPSCDESGTRSDSHEGQDEIKDRRCRSRDNDPVLTEDDPRIVHLSSVSIKRLGSSTARKPETPVEKHEQHGGNVLVLACRQAIPFYVDAFLSIKSVFFSLAWRCMRRRPRMRL